MLLLHAETEEVWLGDDKVEVLVVKLRDVLGCARVRRLRREFFEEDPGYRGEEVDVCWRVKPLLEVACYGLEVL